MKTLHPGVHGGILARRDLPEHLAALEAHGIGAIDAVVVNLYPFRATVTAATAPTFDVAVENIDIGACWAIYLAFTQKDPWIRFLCRLQPVADQVRHATLQCAKAGFFSTAGQFMSALWLLSDLQASGPLHQRSSVAASVRTS